MHNLDTFLIALCLFRPKRLKKSQSLRGKLRVEKTESDDEITTRRDRVTALDDAEQLALHLLSGTR